MALNVFQCFTNECGRLLFQFWTCNVDTQKSKASLPIAFCFLNSKLYNFGETVSIVLWTDTWKPDSFYDKIAANRKQGLHTLCLLGKCAPFNAAFYQDRLGA